MPIRENTTATPCGYTATGRIRKKPTKQFLKEAAEKEAADEEAVPVILATAQPTMANYQKFKKQKMLNCPVCFQNLEHRCDPNRAVWQHLLHHATIAKDKKHQEARDALKSFLGWTRKNGSGLIQQIGGQRMKGRQSVHLRKGQQAQI